MKTQRKHTELYQKLIVPVLFCGRIGSSCSLWIFSLVLYVLVFGQTNALAGGGVDDIRGRWDVDVNVPGIGSVTLFVNDLEVSASGNFAAGCMESEGGIAPLSLQAQQTGDDSYFVSVVSTVIPAAGDPPFPIQLTGPVLTAGGGVPDDVAGGEGSNVRNGDFDGGSWDGVHHDRRRKTCPAVEIPPLRFDADVRVRKDCNPYPDECQARPLFDGFTDIAAANMLVVTPDGTEIIVPPRTGIFSPEVDFVTAFRFFTDDQRDFVSGQPYTFTLLDALGNPIPGTTKTDTWTECLIKPPTTLSATVVGKDIDLSWDAAPLADGFDPANGIGFYQITIDPFGPPAGTFPYGACCIGMLNHLIPWDDFIPGATGTPDGPDFGVALNRFDNRTYSIRVESFAIPPSGSPGQGLECETVDFNEVLVFDKGPDSITIIGGP